MTITASGLDSSVNDSSTIGADGVDLLGFFNQSEAALFNTPATLLPNSTLTASGLTLSYNDVTADNESTGGGSGSFLDLGLYADASATGATGTQTFSTTQPAFTGTWTINLNSLGVSSSALPGAGTQGRIFSGFTGHPGTVIGEWQIQPVPEPGAGSLLLLGSVAGLIFWRRRARRDAVAVA